MKRADIDFENLSSLERPLRNRRQAYYHGKYYRELSFALVGIVFASALLQICK